MQLLIQALRIAVVILIRVLILPGLDDMSNAGPVKNLQEEKRHSHCRRRWTETEILLSMSPVAPPNGSAELVVNENRNYRPKRRAQSNETNNRKHIDVHSHPRKSQAELHKQIRRGGESARKLPCDSK